jgi:hypothetical protein
MKIALWLVAALVAYWLGDGMGVVLVCCTAAIVKALTGKLA